jgi:ligand-binding SRPBCC domain-containing protein
MPAPAIKTLRPNARKRIPPVGISMRTYNLRCEMLVQRPISEVFPFFENAHNLARITPDWLKFTVLTPDPLDMKVGLEIEYKIRLLGVPMNWKSVIAEYEPPFHFVDEQVQGPYRYWHHSHDFRPEGGGTRVIDSVDYALALDPLSRIAHAVMVRHQLNAIFRYRQEALSKIFKGQTTSVLEPVIAAK